MLVIHPDECIDRGVCVPECPAEAIFPDTDPSTTPAWLAINHQYAPVWPNMTRKKVPPTAAVAVTNAAAPQCVALSSEVFGIPQRS